jgi:predicted nucleic acid-binding protein
LIKTIIADSSPLIVLLKSDLENILTELFDEILIPEAVWQEVLSGADDDVAKLKLPLLTWTKRISPTVTNEEIKSYNLGKGETEALSLALEIPKTGVILDDFAARKCARDLKIPFIGTGGLLISAKRKKLILSVSEALEKVQSEGLWLSESIIEMLKQKAGE